MEMEIAQRMGWSLLLLPRPRIRLSLLTVITVELATEGLLTSL